MKKMFSAIFAAGLFATISVFAQAPAPNPSEIPLRMSIRLAAEKGVFYGDEALSANIQLTNPAPQPLDAILVARIIMPVTFDSGDPVTMLNTPVSIPGNGSLKQAISHKVSVPGFYRVMAHLETADKKGPSTTFYLGYEPEKIVYASSAKPDFKEFWDNSLAELAKVEPRCTTTLLPNLCTETQDMYEVRMHSFGDVIVGGHYLVPKKPGKYPTIVRFLGYSSGPSIPERGNDKVIHYVASTRGQGVMKPQNTYGEWMAFRFDSRDDYYYRGAYLDTVRAIDFVCSRPEVDQSRLMVEGNSQGGSLSYICAALDKRVKFCVPTIPGFCDIPNVVKLTAWPGSIFRTYLAKNDKGVTAESMQAMLSYYDVKNFAPWITCPVYMGVGLQDPICPPATNFAPYNLLKCEKRFVIYPESGHGVRGNDFYPRAYAWVNEKFGIK
jgi:cephalosporin-C deacetylase-like acetyl esterase